MKLFAQPINPDAKGFYFESMEEYEEGKKIGGTTYTCTNASDF